MPLMPGTPQLPEGRGRAIAHFDSAEKARAAAREIGAEPPVEVPTQDWSVVWRAHHRTVRVGPRSWVVPPWEERPPQGVSVVIEPGMAFGTGSHPTTALCLEACDELLARAPAASVLDVGTGSGVIALLAKKLGAGRVVATENDPVALEVARAGAALNGVSDVEWVLAEDPGEIRGHFQIVFANILLNTLQDLAPAIAPKVEERGRAVLSGLLEPQGDAAARAYAAQGLREVRRETREGWIRLELAR